MAHIKKTKSGKYAAQLFVNGTRKQKTFSLEADAKKWIKNTEALILNKKNAPPTVKKIIQEYIHYLKTDNGKEIQKVDKEAIHTRTSAR